MSLKHWQTYYKSGALATCPTGPEGTYDLELRDAWVEFFTGLSNPARILDVGTGNGAVALIASETATSLSRTYEVHGTDLANINPMRDVVNSTRLAGITFHPGVATEHLPFEENYFDAVCGQYALEYMKMDAALAEIARVLIPTGIVQFVLHSTDSIIVKNAQLSLQQANLVLNETRIYRKLKRFVLAERKASTNTGRYYQDLRTAADTLKQGIEKSGSSRLVLAATLDAVQKLLQARTRLTPVALEREIDRVVSELRDSVRRLNDLTRCALTEEELTQLETLARATGFDVTEREPQLHGGKNLVGWRVRLVLA